jgi:hypothetical protein
VDEPNRAWSALKKYLNQVFSEVTTPSGDMIFTNGYSRPFIRPISQRGPNSIQNHAARLYRLHNTKDTCMGDYVSEQNIISRYFHLDVGGKLKPYRDAFISQLAQLSNDDAGTAESIWHLIDEAVRLTERNSDISSELENRFPHSLSEAIRYYGVNSQSYGS